MFAKHRTARRRRGSAARAGVAMKSATGGRSSAATSANMSEVLYPAVSCPEGNAVYTQRGCTKLMFMQKHPGWLSEHMTYAATSSWSSISLWVNPCILLTCLISAHGARVAISSQWLGTLGTHKSHVMSRLIFTNCISNQACD